MKLDKSLLHRVKCIIPVLSFFLFFNIDAFAQPDRDWHLGSGNNGIEIEKVYSFLQNKPATEVVVAVIDSGVDSVSYTHLTLPTTSRV